MKSLKTYMRMFGFIKPYITLFILSTLFSFIVVSMESIALWFTGSLPDILFNPDLKILTKPEFSFNTSTINKILKYFTYTAIHSDLFSNPLAAVCILICITFTAKNSILYGNKLLICFINLKIVKDIRNILYRHVLKLPVSYYDKNKSGSIVSLVVNDISIINNSLVGTLNKLIITPIHLLIYIGILIIINVKLTLLVFTIYPVLGFIILKIGHIVKRRSKKMLERFSGMISVLTETISGVRAVKMFNMNDVENKKFNKENNQFTTSLFRSEAASTITSPLNETLAMIVTSILLWYGGNDALHGSASFTSEDFFRFLIFLFLSYKPLKTLGSIHNAIQTGIAAAERVFELLDTKTEIIQYSMQSKPHRFTQSISFKNVSFSYDKNNELVLQNLSFSIKRGQVLAIVGSSGSGKTTILDLLPRFYDIEKGEICIDGSNINTFDLYTLRNLFGIVSQEVILFNDTIGNNISYGYQNASKVEIENAAIAANAMEFIGQLPDGMNTMIGERGVALSGGQRQRLSIARALLRNPQILILDEATSSLDTESEKLVQTAIDTLIQNRTVFVVAHRLSTITHADKIIVLEKGMIIEEGTHSELLAMKKRYKYFYDIQFSQKDL